MESYFWRSKVGVRSSEERGGLGATAAAVTVTAYTPSFFPYTRIEMMKGEGETS